MQRRRLLAAAAATLAIPAASRWRAAGAQSSTLRIQRPLDLVALPLLVMEHEHMIERVAEAMGVGTLTVAWSIPGETPALEALAAGENDLVAADLTPFLIAAGATEGTPAAVRAVAALATRPYVLVTRNPAVHTIRDFGSADRIAVPAVKVSGPAVLLQMAAALEWGIEHHDRLDRLTVARPDAAAAAMLLSGKGDIDAHFSRTPYADDELADPAISRVMDSFDIAGPHSAALLVATKRLCDAGPTLCAAILSALQEADDFIKGSPGAAAEIFAAIVKDRDIPLEDLADMIGDPDLAYTAAPAGVVRFGDFMHRTGRLPRPAAAWQELFIPEAKDLKGS